MVITPKGNGKSSTLSTSNPQYYIATISISCDALNSTHDPTFSRGAIVFQIGTSTVQLAGALNPGDLGRTGSIVYTSSPVAIDAPVQLSIGGAQCPLTPDSALSFVIIIDSISVGSVVYQATYPFPTIQVAYPLQAQNIYGVTTIHGDAQVDPSPDSSAAVTWTVYDDNGDQRSNQPADFDITGYSGVAYVVATATNRYGSTESDPVQIWIDPMNTPAGNKIYTRYGGTLTIGINGADPSFYDPANAMQLTLNNTPLLSSSVTEAQVSVGQWSTLDFRLMKNGHERVPGGNLQILSGYGQADFDETDYYTLFSFYIYLTIDSTQQTLPPNWVYGDPFYLSDPFVPSQTLFIAPVTGELMLQITGASTAAIDTLFLQSPVKKVLLINPSGNIGDTLDCGVVTAGDTIQFYLRSNMSIVAGQNMYPEITLPDTGGVIASIAAKGRQTGGVFPVDKRKLLLKSHGVDQSLQKRLFTEKIKSHLIRNPLSTSQVVHLQQKNVETQGAKKSVSKPAIIIGPGNSNPITTLAFEDWTDLDFDDVQAGAWISTAGCPTVVLSSDHMNPGDTVDVTVKKKLNDTTYIDYPAGTLFDIGIWSGIGYGTLLANGADSTSFDDVTMPIKFIATDSLALDSVVVTIYGAPDNGSSASGIAGKSGNKKMLTQAYKPQKGGKKFLAALDNSTCSGPTKGTIVKYKLTVNTCLEDILNNGQTAIRVTVSPTAPPDDKKMSISVGPEGLGYAKIKDLRSGDEGFSLSDIPYQDIKNRQVVIEGTGKTIPGTFPLGVRFFVSWAGGAKPLDTGSVFLSGSNTTCPEYTQNDGRWSSTTYDSRNGDIGHKGCALTDLANSLSAEGKDWNPLTLNAYMIINHKYDATGGVDWNAMEYLGGLKIKKPLGKQTNLKNGVILSPSELADLDGALAAGSYVIAQVKDVHPNGDVIPHWISITGKNNGIYSIFDPGNTSGSYCKKVVLDAYKNEIFRAQIFSRN